MVKFFGLTVITALFVGLILGIIIGFVPGLVVGHCVWPKQAKAPAAAQCEAPTAAGQRRPVGPHGSRSLPSQKRIPPKTP